VKRAIITGATGLIGTAVAKHFSSLGIELLCLGRQKLTAEEIDRSLGAGSSYLSLAMEDISSLPTQAESIGWSSGGQTVFFNFAWGGNQRLTDGEFSDQLNNAVYAAEAMRTAKRLGCIKFVNSGTLEETFVEQFLQGDREQPYASEQTNYALAKLAARDMCKMVAYIEKIDYVHTRLSVPLASDLSRGNYVALTLKKIAQGEVSEAPQNEQLFDIVLTDDVARAYYLIGQRGMNKADYFIGTSRPATLKQHFERFKSLLQGAHVEDYATVTDSRAQFFDPLALQLDTGFVASAGLQEIIQHVRQR
jgi:nucleoside-diphosphate-sugar epimerase